jgi:predicted nucleotidyltransferase
MASNLPLLEEAAAKLKHLLPEVVFVGGATLDLMVTDRGSNPIRSTYDVDVIVAADYADYSAFCDRLRDIGFGNDTRPHAPLCRFLHGELMLDVMPTQKGVLGFSNRWYEGAIRTATPATLPSGKVIRLIAAPYFLGTKMEAFYDRGENDYYMSHDLEDFIAVVDGRERLLEELAEVPADLCQYLGEAASKLLANERFLEALPGYVPGDLISQRRVAIILERLKTISKLEAMEPFHSYKEIATRDQAREAD